jgi:hypothetical protein
MALLKSFLFQAMVLSLGLGLAFAQGEEEGAKGFNQELKDLDVKWALGEVMNVDLENKIISIKYLDYEDGGEKDISVLIAPETIFENIESLEEIKPQDYLSLDYVLTQDGKNISKNISLDKPKETESIEKAEAGGRLSEVGD